MKVGGSNPPGQALRLVLMAKNKNRPRRQHKDKYGFKKSRGSGANIDDLLAIPLERSGRKQKRKNSNNNSRSCSQEIDAIAKELFGGKYWCVKSHGKKDESL